MYQQETFTAREKFDLFIQALLNLNNLELEERKYYAVLANFIKCRLRQFNLHCVTMEDVIFESYIRGVKLIESGQEIKNPAPWLRITSLNVIREMSRNKERQQLVNSDLRVQQIALEFSSSRASEKVNAEALKILELSLQKLQSMDYKIIVLREIKSLSWKEVVRNLANDGEIVTEASARQRGKRALERLRKIYFSIKPATF